MKRATADPVVARRSDRPDMPEFRMHQAVDRSMPRDQPCADPGADRHIGDVRQALRRTPARLGQRRADDVGMEAGRHRISTLQAPGDVGPRPTGLGRRGDMAVITAAPVNPDRAEACDPDCDETGPAVEHGFDRGKRLIGASCRNSYDFLDRIGPSRQDTDALGPAKFDPGHQWYFAHPCPQTNALAAAIRPAGQIRQVAVIYSMLTT